MPLSDDLMPPGADPSRDPAKMYEPLKANVLIRVGLPGKGTQ
jgi:hypothetical protein